MFPDQVKNRFSIIIYTYGVASNTITAFSSKQIYSIDTDKSLNTNTSYSLKCQIKVN